MPSISDFVSVSLAIGDRTLDRASFSKIMILGPSQVFPERVRTYEASSALTAMTTDGFTVNSPEYKAMAAVLASNLNRPDVVKVGRRAAANVPTQDLTFGPLDVVDGAIFTIDVNGTEFTYTTGAAEGAADVAAALVSAINGGSEPVTATDNLDGTFDIVDDVAGAQNDFYGKAGKFSCVDNSVDANVATELAAIATIDDEWYGLILASNSEAENEAAAAWANPLGKQFVPVSMSTDQKGAGSADTASTLQGLSYNYVGAKYHERALSFPSAAWMGQMYSYEPGQATWKFKELEGIAKSNLTATEATNLKGKNCNYYVDIGGRGMTFEGWAASGRFMDVTRFADWLVNTVQVNVANILANNPKVPYDDGGILKLSGGVKEALEEGADNSGLALDPAATVTPTYKADQTTTDIANRHLAGMKFSATYTGAIHSVTISGTLAL